MGTLKVYIYLCIFSITIFSSDSKTVASDEEKYSLDYEQAFEEQLGSKGNEEAPPAGKGDDTDGKTTANLGSLVNVFKKPFIVRGQDRKGWEEEALIFKLFGQSYAETDSGNSYRATVRCGLLETYLYKNQPY